MQETVFRGRDIAEDTLICDVRSSRIGHNVESTQNSIPVGRYAKQTLALAAGFRADEIRQTGFGKMQMQLITARRQRNVIAEITAPHMPIDIGVQRPEDLLGWSDENIAPCEKLVRPPRCCCDPRKHWSSPRSSADRR